MEIKTSPTTIRHQISKSFAIITDYECLNPTYKNKGDEINQKFDCIDLTIIRAFFLSLTTTNNKSGEPYLSIEQLNTFIERAFKGNKNLPKVKFNALYGEYTQIIYLFYIFYTISVQHEALGSRSVIKLKYQKLLTDNFENFGTMNHVRDNFHKAPKINPWIFMPHDSLNVLIRKCSSYTT
jgi:hypothetical protein